MRPIMSALCEGSTVLFCLFISFKIQDYFIISSEKLKLSHQIRLYRFLFDLIVFKSGRYQNSREDIKTELVVERRPVFL